ncbi:MAG: hypothetical protein FJ246_10100 [Nitrospira sp.]|nr:hypothetical protein [Nitrospira sp.]
MARKPGNAPLTHRHLKERQRAEREAFSPNLSLRVHRALSWLGRAEQFGREQDVDGQFIYLWIAFNAAYTIDFLRPRQSSARDWTA